MYNYDANLHYIATPDDPNAPSESIIGTAKNPSLTNAQLFYLLESRWIKPVPLRASEGRVGPRSVDIVETEVNGQRVDFAFDRESHLPIRISEFRNGEMRPFYVQYLSDYAEINGIKIPLQLSDNEADRADRMTIQINVDYDESVFVKPPPISAGPEAWRAKR